MSTGLMMLSHENHFISLVLGILNFLLAPHGHDFGYLQIEILVPHYNFKGHRHNICKHMQCFEGLKEYAQCKTRYLDDLKEWL
jgi:hypothetical protein